MILIVNLINRALSTRIMALTLALSVAGFVAVPPGRSQAQQDRERQIVRTGSESQSGGKRVALLINGAYTGAPSLKNPPNDARDMAATLKGLGFDVTSGINVNLVQACQHLWLVLSNGIYQRFTMC